MSASHIEAVLEHAYNQGIQNGKRGIFKEDDDMPSQLFQQLMESLPDHVYFKDLQSRFICVNKAMANYFGLNDPNEIIGKSDFDFFEPETAQIKFEAEQEIIRTGEGWSFREEKEIRDRAQDKFFISSKLPLRDANGMIYGTFGLSRDITKQKSAEQEVQRQRRLLETIIRILPCRLFIRDKENRFILVNEEYRNCLGIPEDYDVRGRLLTDIIDNPRTENVLQEDRNVVESGEPITNKLEYDQSIMAGNRWVLTSKVPLRSDSGEIDGIVGMSLDITEQKKAEELARKTKEALQAKSEQFEEELLVARQLQEQLMSMGFDEKHLYSKTCDKWTFQACYLYNPSHHLAGDFFHLLPIGKDKIGLLVCDVMGHGVKASLVTMLIRGLMSEIPHMLNQPSQVLRHLNETLLSLAEDEEFPRFVTAVYMTVDLESGKATLANAGHPCPIFHYANGESSPYTECPCNEIGPALGLLPDERFRDTSFEFEGPNEFFFFTDGIVEQTTSSGEDFGKVGLVNALESMTGKPINMQLKHVSKRLRAVLRNQSTTDDICVVALSVKPAAV